MARLEIAHGMFENGMAYSRFGSGSKTVLSVPAGPGNTIPHGVMERMVVRMFRPFIRDDYSVWFVTRRLDMPKGHTIEKMAEDYAALVDEVFDGRVDVFLGISFGGAIGIYLAANHPERFGRFVLVGIGYEVSAEGKQLDYRFAKKLSAGDRSGAGEVVAEDMISKSWFRRFPWIAKVIGPPVGHVMFGGHPHPFYEKDILTEAEAEVAFDARSVLPTIQVPILLIAGDRDDYFPRQVLEETARLIPDCTLRLYPGKGHEGAIMDRRMARDALRFVEHW